MEAIGLTTSDYGIVYGTFWLGIFIFGLVIGEYIGYVGVIVSSYFNCCHITTIKTSENHHHWCRHHRVDLHRIRVNAVCHQQRCIYGNRNRFETD